MLTTKHCEGLFAVLHSLFSFIQFPGQRGELCIKIFIDTKNKMIFFKEMACLSGLVCASIFYSAEVL